MGRASSTPPSADLLQGTLDLLILRVLKSGPQHGWGIADLIKAHSAEALSIGEGSLYPALYRLHERGWVTSEWGRSDKQRRAKFYNLTPAGRQALIRELAAWERLTAAIDGVLRHA